MKHRVKKFLQTLLGLNNYLFIFAIIKILTLRWDRLEGEFMHFLQFVPEEGIVLDIGANIGIMTVLLARQARRGTVHAFEPMPANFATLKRVVAWFRCANVTLYPIALGNENKIVTMVMPVVDSVHQQGLSHVVGGHLAAEAGDEIQVDCKRLDDMEAFFAPNVRVTAIKIDVQDFEYFVLDGARKLLQMHRPAIYCEMGDDEYRTKCIELFHELNYDIKVFTNNNLTLFDPQRHREIWNFFVIPRQ